MMEKDFLSASAIANLSVLEFKIEMYNVQRTPHDDWNGTCLKK